MLELLAPTCREPEERVELMNEDSQGASSAAMHSVGNEWMAKVQRETVPSP